MDWVTQLADRVENSKPEGHINVASGISPSGPIHVGNLREVLTGHFVASELKSRGRDVTHRIYWDDADRYRKVPAGVPGVDETWLNYIGYPLSMVPAPNGSEHANWADHFRSSFVSILDTLGVEYVGISQWEAYNDGVYLDYCVQAMNNRVNIGTILAGFQTKGDVMDPETYYPYKPYCANCFKDTTVVRSWNSVSTEIKYECKSCEYIETLPLAELTGKLVWKVDWPMRWAADSIDFEPGGVDHMSPGSSWDAGKLIAPVFGGTRPLGQAYSFVGTSGEAKISSSKGGAITPAEMLEIMPPEILRWLYIRSRPNQAFSIDVDSVNNVSRLYDEWFVLTNRVNNGKASADDARTHYNAVNHVQAPLVEQPNVKFSSWVSFADMTLGDREACVKLADVVLNSTDEALLSYAINWVNVFMPETDRTVISPAFNEEFFNSLSTDHQGAIRLLAERLPEFYDGDLTMWCFGAAKVYFGVDALERNLTPELKAFQQEYFKNVYTLLIGREKGPRLPVLIQCIGLDESRSLLGGM